MPKLVPISSIKMMKILKSLGFSLIRIKGSHYFWHCERMGKNTIVPKHSRETLDTSLKMLNTRCLTFARTVLSKVIPLLRLRGGLKVVFLI